MPGHGESHDAKADESHFLVRHASFLDFVIRQSRSHDLITGAPS